MANLLKNGNAYIIDNDVYFDISTFKDYGKLSGKNIADLIAGHRVTTNVSRKRNPGDFVLWKGDDQESYWQSPWGRGRPGWHIECSAMAHKYLGKTFDIHGGGMDLTFPHHENEIAQSESITHAPLAQMWLHNAFININHEKMSKSLGNALNLKETFRVVDPMVLRFYFLQHHYRTPLDFNIFDLKGVKIAYQKLAALAEDFHFQDPAAIGTLDSLPAFCRSIGEALLDDLNTPKALGIIFENLNEIKKNASTRGWVVGMLQSVFGLTLVPLKKQEQHITPEIEDLLREREIARQTSNWSRADALRERLKNLGYLVQDKKTN